MLEVCFEVSCEIEGVFPSVTSDFEEINLDDIPQDEEKATIGFISSQLPASRTKVQSSQPEPSAQFLF